MTITSERTAPYLGAHPELKKVYEDSLLNCKRYWRKSRDFSKILQWGVLFELSLAIHISYTGNYWLALILAVLCLWFVRQSKYHETCARFWLEQISLDERALRATDFATVKSIMTRQVWLFEYRNEWPVWRSLLGWLQPDPKPQPPYL